MKYLALLLLCSCATTAEQLEEKRERAAWKQNIDLENWAVCEKIYRDRGRATVHMDHEHGRHKKIRPWMIKSDLTENMCRVIMGESWIRY